MPAALNSEDTLLLLASRLHPSPDHVQKTDELLLSVSDWAYFTTNAIRNGVAPLIYKNISSLSNSGNIPNEAITRLKQTYYISLQKNIVLYEHFRKVINALSAKGIRAIALKGIFLAEVVYKDVGLRQMSDIDLLVKEEDKENCVHTLLDMGYVFGEQFKTGFIKRQYVKEHLPALVMNGVSVDIHTAIHQRKSKYNVNINDYWERAQAVTIHETPTYALSPHDLLQHLCIHLNRHHNTGNMQLFSLRDVAEVLKYYKDDIKWESLEESCALYNCKANVFKYFFIVNKYFDAPVPDVILQKAKQFYDSRSEKLFIHYLKANRKEIQREIDNKTIKKVKQTKGFFNKIAYLLGEVFPSRRYMCQRYMIKRKPLVYWFYLVRIISGFYYLLLHLKKRSVK